MLSQVKVLLHFSALLLTAVAVLAVPRPGAAAGLGRIGADQASPSQDAPPPSTLTVFIQGNPIGSEEVTVASDAEGWTIRATGRLGVPVNLSTVRFEVRYDRNWQPVSLVVESSLRGQPLLLNTTFSGGAAASSITQAGQQTQKTDQVAADTVVLPNMFFAAYEALALRLPSVSPGTELRAYIAPQVEIPVRVGESTQERIKTGSRTITARRYVLTIMNPGGALPAELWADEENRLIRFRLPTQSLEVAREDVATVSARIERLARADDEQVRIQAAGFSLTGTVSKPAPGSAQRGLHPAVILLPGSGPVDRDETVAGIPVFAQLANALADAGFLVVRYDKRGVGQSGGRAEAASINDYAEDARAVVKYIEKRKDVDKRRIVLLGHSEGGLIGMVAASQEKKRVAALALLATPSTTGGELVLEQQRHLLDGMNLPEADKQSRIDLQQRIQAAVLSGRGWEGIPEGLRVQADTPWFKSFLAFDPARIMSKVEQPIAVFQGERDRQVPVRHAYRLVELAKARKKDRSVELFILDGLNHLLVPAPTGEVSEYPTLEDKNVSPTLIDPLIRWLRETTGAATGDAGQATGRAATGDGQRPAVRPSVP